MRVKRLVLVTTRRSGGKPSSRIYRNGVTMNMRAHTLITVGVFAVVLAGPWGTALGKEAPSTTPEPEKTPSGPTENPAAPEAQEPTISANGNLDVVHLRNGGMVRGTISEQIPGERVVIVTLSGEVRSFPMSEVAYAGPLADAPGAQQEPGTPSPAAAQHRAGQQRETLQPLVVVQTEAAQVEF